MWILIKKFEVIETENKLVVPESGVFAAYTLLVMRWISSGDIIHNAVTRVKNIVLNI